MNQEKAKEVIESIAKDFSRWDQGEWSNIGYNENLGFADVNVFKEKTEENQVINCGTTACVAGHTTFLTAPVGSRFYNARVSLPFDPETNQRPSYTYQSYACKVLELTDDETSYLFSAARTWEEILAFINGTDDERNNIINNHYAL